MLGAAGSTKLALPRCERGLGELILRPDAPQLIDGVRVAPFPYWPDDRGYFLEVARLGQGLPAAFPGTSTQVSATLGYPGTIKAFHYHLRQSDLWVPCRGMLQVALCDLRENSGTHGARNTFYIGQSRPWKILIPPGVAHGYKVIGNSESMLVYVTDRHYDPSDEGRLPYDSPEIAYDWETQHR